MWIVDELRQRGGAVTFRDFMELALYHPEHGYYADPGSRYGRGGDFLTAPTASTWYGAVLGSWIVRLAEQVGPLGLVDLGSGDGAFLAAVLGHPRAADVIAGVASVERSQAMRREQQARWSCEPPFDLALVSSLDELEPPGGPVVVHASELYDASPVHRVVGRASGLAELWVVADERGLRWNERPASRVLERYLDGYGVVLDEGQLAEISPVAEDRHARLLEWAGDRAVVVVLDYGYEADRLYDPRGRRGGSLTCFREHRLSRDPLVDPGEQDITAHVNWDDLRRAARVTDRVEIGLWPLAELLVRAGLEREVERRGLGIEAELDTDTLTERQEIKRLLDPDGMGTDLKALVQAAPAMAEPVIDTLRLEHHASG
jgi:SAM-dependent MidA family methyltransferase